MNRYKLTWLFFLLLVTTIGYAQDNHNYATPLNETVYTITQDDATGYILPMSYLSNIPTGRDGLTFEFSISGDLKDLPNGKQVRILGFYTGESTPGDNGCFLELYYKDSTISIRRRLAQGSSAYYDYELYDPMFSSNTDFSEWVVTVYVTGYYIWMQTKDTTKFIDNYWHAPIFFGINLPSQDFMSQYLSRSNLARVIFGDPASPVAYKIPHEISIYAFTYANLKDELQKNFSSPK